MCLACRLNVVGSLKALGVLKDAQDLITGLSVIGTDTAAAANLTFWHHALDICSGEQWLQAYLGVKRFEYISYFGA